jgi:16S rRNA (cytidine1402-2'-O)-methyltransferase
MATSLRNNVEMNNEIAQESGIVTQVQAGHVYFVATPIGNLGDITLRGIDVLKNVDLICCEDTRKTSHLLKMLSLPFKAFLSHHEHNQFETIDKIIQKAKDGSSVAVVSDAGTPGISDPGSPLAAALARNNIPTHPIPGASAVVSALSIAGFPATPFTFIGFLPIKGKERTKLMTVIKSSPHTLVFYEAPHRVLRLFKSLIDVPDMASRPCVSCRELTKKFEEFQRGTVQELYEKYKTIEEVSNQKVISVLQ